MNRIWYHHFGAGLVESLENFGVKAESPSHPQLLDWLAVEFIKSGFSVKRMHRLMMTSRTYRQSSRVSEAQLTADPRNRFLSRMPLKRLDAEALRDSLLFVSGQLDHSAGGPPDTISVNGDGLVSVKPTPAGQWRRSVYLQYRRTEIPSMMATFDYPVMGPNCVSRSTSTVSPQSLMLMNDDHVRHLAGKFALRIQESMREPGDMNNSAVVRAVYQTAFSREPSEDELLLGESALSQLTNAWNGNPKSALETYCHTILNSAAFIYVD